MMSMFFLTLGMVSSGLQAFLVTALAAVQGITLETASLALTCFLATAAGGVLVGGYVGDRTSRHGPFVAACIAAAGLMLLSVGLVPMSGIVILVLFAAVGLTHGMIRPSRDIMVRQITPEGDIGKVFGFVSTGLNIGGAIAPAIFGLILDHGAPEWIFWAFGIFTILCLATLGTTRMYAAPPAAVRAAE
jgi:FSR family fosmidomycin resistance protein-like MFS transporter